MDDLSATEKARDMALGSADGFQQLSTKLFDALKELVGEIKRKIATGAYDDEAGLSELVNSIEMLNAEGSLEDADRDYRG